VLFSGCIWPSVECELGQGQQMVPVGLMEVREDLDILFKLLIGTF
jgi:hypothetical protein